MPEVSALSPSERDALFLRRSFDVARRAMTHGNHPFGAILVGPDGKDVATYFHSDEFNQPNDLTLAGDGIIYASDPNWKQHDGQIWRIGKSADGTVLGEKMTADRQMSTTNGIDLSPDGKTLYVGESDTREIWSYRIDGTRLISPKLVKRFPDFDIDGLRTDTEGTLFVARILKGTIAVLSPQGKLKREISLGAKEPTNLAFGGPTERRSL